MNRGPEGPAGVRVPALFNDERSHKVVSGRDKYMYCNKHQAPSAGGMQSAS